MGQDTPSFWFRCPACARPLRGRPDAIGHQMRCPNGACGSTIIVPAETMSAPDLALSPAESSPELFETSSYVSMPSTRSPHRLLWPVLGLSVLGMAVVVAMLLKYYFQEPPLPHNDLSVEHDRYVRQLEKMPLNKSLLPEASRRLAAAFNEAENLDGGWQLESLVVHPPVGDPPDDLRPTVRAFAATMPSDWPRYVQRQAEKIQRALRDNSDGSTLGAESPEPLVAAMALPPTALFTPEELSDLEAELNTVQSDLEVAQSVAHRPRASFPFAWPKDLRRFLLGTSAIALSAQLPTALEPSAQEFYQGKDVSQLGQLLGYDLTYRMQKNDAAGAVLDCNAMLNLAAALRDTPTHAAQSQRVELLAMLAVKLEALMALVEVPSDALGQLRTRLAREAAVPGFLYAARGERAALDRVCDGMEKGGIPAERLLGDSWAERLLGAGFTDQEKQQTLILVRAMVLEKTNRKVEIQKIRVEEQSEHWDGFLGTLSEMPALLRPLVSKGQLTPYRDVRLRCTIVGLAAEQYRQQRGAWPDQLADLVPDFMPVLPCDPYFPAFALSYRKFADGVVIFSPGPNRNAARRMAPDFNLLEALNNGRLTNCVGVRLWNPSVRRQPRA